MPKHQLPGEKIQGGEDNQPVVHELNSLLQILNRSQDDDEDGLLGVRNLDDAAGPIVVGDVCDSNVYYTGGTWWLDRWLPPTSVFPVTSPAEYVGHGEKVDMGVCKRDMLVSHIVLPRQNVGKNDNYICLGTKKWKIGTRTGTWWPSLGLRWTARRSMWKSISVARSRLSRAVQILDIFNCPVHAYYKNVIDCIPSKNCHDIFKKR